MREFLEKLQEDQRRMRKFLRSHALHFKRMGEVLAGVRKRGSRVFVVGEPPLDGVATVIAEDYLTALPALPIDLTLPQPPSVNPDEEPPATQREAAARQAGRHFHRGDCLLAFLLDGEDRETRILLEAARAKRARVLIIGGLGAKSANNKRLSKVLLALPTRGVKTVCESSFVTARILARVSRAAYRGKNDIEDGPLVQATCETCNERVFFEEKDRGRDVECPLCEGEMRLAKDATRRVAALTPPPARTPRRKRKPKPSVLDLPTLDAEELELIAAAELAEAEDSSLEQPDLPGDMPPELPVGLSDEVSGRLPAAGSARLTSAPDPSFGSDIMVGSEIVSVTDDDEDESKTAAGLGTTASADPFGMEEDYLSDMTMPRGSSHPSSHTSADDALPTGTPPSSSRRVSARYTISECRLRWGRGGFPDETSPEHELVTFSASRIEFVLNPDDEAGNTLQKGDELWVRIEIPAFLEPILVRGALEDISGIAGNGGGARAELAFLDVDPMVQVKLDRAASNLGASV